MILIIDTTDAKFGHKVAEELEKRSKGKIVKYIDTEKKKISPCAGCNYCWLKTPGECVIKDDYEPILKDMSIAEQVWLISDTSFGFVSYKTKNIVDRVMPLVTMNLHFKKGQMRHIMRYKHNPNFGIIYTGDGDKEYLNRWCERVAVNFGSKSLGAYREDCVGEAVACM